MAHSFFVIHLVVLALGMFLFCAAAVAALLYFLEHRELKHKKFGKLFAWLPSLERLDSMTIRTLRVGFVCLTLGMLTGLVLAHAQWRGDWLENPKFIISFGVWFWYFLLLVLRGRAGLRGGRFFTLIVIGFVFLLLTFIGFMWIFPKSTA